MKHAGVTAAALFCSSMLFVGTSVRANSGVPDLVLRAAAFNAQSTSGILVGERHVAFNASAGPAHFSQQNDAVIMLEDGEYKRLRFLRIVENGKTLSPDQVAQKESQNNADLDRGKSFFKQPYDTRYLHDYTFAEATCTCSPGEREIAFTSSVHDDQHGDGTMTIDAATGRVISLTYVPNVLPDRANSATVTETFGEVAPGVWTIMTIDHEFGGRVAFIHGSGKMIERLDHFQRFTSAYSGMQYLQRVSDSR